MAVTKDHLRTAVERLRKGDLLSEITKDLGYEGDELWEAVRHFGFFAKNGRFVNDVAVK